MNIALHNTILFFSYRCFLQIRICPRNGQCTYQIRKFGLGLEGSFQSSGLLNRSFAASNSASAQESFICRPRRMSATTGGSSDLLNRSMTYSACAEEEIPDLLICSICLCLMSDPRQGKCGHCFCQKCLEKAFTSAPNNAGIRVHRRILCPTCRGDIHEADVVISLIAKQFIDKIRIRCPEILHESATEALICSWNGTESCLNTSILLAHSISSVFLYSLYSLKHDVIP